jgi:hypothetical protein
VIAFGAATAFAGCGGGEEAASDTPVTRDHEIVEHGQAGRLRVSLEMSAGEFEVTSGGAAVMEGDFAYNVATLKPAIAYQVTNGEGDLRVTQKGHSKGNVTNRWQVKLAESTPMALSLSLSAGEARFALGRLNLSSLDVSLGAGELEVDLRGTPTASYRADIQAGAGDTTVRVPLSVGISVRTLGAIGGVSITGLEERDGRWVNPRLPSPAVTIDLNVKQGVGDLKIIAE